MIGKYYVANREVLANIFPLKRSGEGARFAGLIDGEGVFLISLKHNPNTQEKKDVRFSLALSQIEGFVLKPLIQKLGGGVRKNEKDYTFI